MLRRAPSCFFLLLISLTLFFSDAFGINPVNQSKQSTNYTKEETHLLSLKPSQTKKSTVKKRLKKLIKHHDDLKKFTDGIYNLLKSASPDNKTFNRSKENRRLDALADLLVGDEVCVAVAFDTDEKILLFASNKCNHNKSFVRVSSVLDFTQGIINKEFWGNSWVNNPYKMNPQACGDCVCTAKIELDGKTIEELSQTIHCIILSEKLSKSIKDALTMIPQCAMLIKLIEGNLILFVDDNYEPIPSLYFDFGKLDCYNESMIAFEHPLHYVATKEKLCDNEYPPFIFIDPKDFFTKRIYAVIDYLSLVMRALEHPEFDDKSINRMLHEPKIHLLKWTLLWEISRKYTGTDRLRNYSVPDVDQQEIKDFVQNICDDFLKFKENKSRQFNDDQQIDGAIREWWETIKSGEKEIKIPKIMLKDDESDLEKAIGAIICQYFINIEKLEKYVKEPNNQLELLKQGTPFAQKEWTKIIDEDEEGVHAEIRILLYMLENGKKIPYIATSKLCCCYCSLVMQQFVVQEFSGRHGKAYPNWTLPKKFKENKQYMETLFGKDLYKLYDIFKKETIKSADGIECNKGEVALLIFKTMAEFTDKDYKEIFGEECKYTKLWPEGCDHREESDDDSSSDEYDTDDDKMIQSNPSSTTSSSASSSASSSTSSSTSSSASSSSSSSTSSSTSSTTSSSTSSNNVLLENKDIEEAKRVSLSDAKKSGKIGPKEIPGWTLQDVEGRGNCFYMALSEQLTLLRHPILKKVQSGTKTHNFLRSDISNAMGRRSVDREWAGEEETYWEIARRYGVAVGVVDTRDQYQQLVYYYINNLGGNDRTDNMSVVMEQEHVRAGIVRLAYTGTHYLSVVKAPFDEFEGNGVTAELPLPVQTQAQNFTVNNISPRLETMIHQLPTLESGVKVSPTIFSRTQ